MSLIQKPPSNSRHEQFDMNVQRNNNISRSAGPGEGYEGETPQVSNRYCKTLLSAQGAWFKVATAESCFRFLGTAQELGVNTNDVQNFLETQLKLRKIRYIVSVYS